MALPPTTSAEPEFFNRLAAIEALRARGAELLLAEIAESTEIQGLQERMREAKDNGDEWEIDADNLDQALLDRRRSGGEAAGWSICSIPSDTAHSFGQGDEPGSRAVRSNCSFGVRLVDVKGARVPLYALLAFPGSGVSTVLTSLGRSPEVLATAHNPDNLFATAGAGDLVSVG